MTSIDETVRRHKFILDESEMPTAWYNIVPDLPSPPPPALHPGTLQPAGPDDFAPLLAMLRDFRHNNGTLSGVDVQQEEHERYQRAFWMRVHGTVPTPAEIGPLPEFARQAQAAYKVLAATGGGSIRSLSHDADVNHQVMILVFGDKWQDEVSRFASR